MIGQSNHQQQMMMVTNFGGCKTLINDLRFDIDEINSRLQISDRPTVDTNANNSEVKIPTASNKSMVESQRSFYGTKELVNFDLSEDSEDEIVRVTLNAKAQELRGTNEEDPSYLVSDYAQLEENKMKLEKKIGEEFFEIYGRLDD